MAITVNLDPVETAHDELTEALTALRTLGNTPIKSGDGWMARCPTHEDAKRSLSLTESETGKLLMHCHAGCDYPDIKAKLGIPDRKPVGSEPRVTVSAPKPRIVATYPYTDARGQTLYEVLRYEPKDFRQRRPDGNGGHTWSLGDVERVLFDLPGVLAAVEIADRPIYLVEGEKDAIRIIREGGSATTLAGGAAYSKKRAETLKILRPLIGCPIVHVVTDNDDAGRAHAQRLYSALTELGILADILEPAIDTPKADASDHFEAGYGIAHLRPAKVFGTEETAPAEQLPEEAAEPETLGSPPVELLDLNQLLRNPPPPPQWAWDNYIERGTLAVLHGDGGLGKSLIGMGLCRRYTLGLEWLTHDTANGHALYLDGENSLHEIARRLYSFEVRPGETRLHYGRVSIPILLNPDAGEALLEKLILDTTCSLLVLDSQRALWGGDEKEALEVRPMYAMLARLAERLNVAILLIHHDNKSGLYSGSTDINAAVVSRLHLERKNPKNRKDRKRILWHEKSRSGPEADDVTFTVDKNHDGVLTFAIHDNDDDDAQATESYRVPRDTTADRILNLLADRVPRKRFEVARELGIEASNGTLRRAWDELIANGSITPTAPDTYTKS